MAGNPSEGAGEDVGTEARAPHAQDQCVPEARQAHVLGDPAELLAASALLIDEAKPAHPPILVPAGPQGGVPPPEAGHLLPRDPFGEGSFHLTGQ